MPPASLLPGSKYVARYDLVLLLSDMLPLSKVHHTPVRLSTCIPLHRPWLPEIEGSQKEQLQLLAAYHQVVIENPGCSSQHNQIVIRRTIGWTHHRTMVGLGKGSLLSTFSGIVMDYFIFVL